mgnify:CR=1 FL=1
MQCNKCGANVTESAKFCSMCGASASVDLTGVNFTHKGPDEAFCTSCGQVIKAMAEICPKCGVRQRGSNQESSLLLKIMIGLVGFIVLFIIVAMVAWFESAS